MPLGKASIRVNAPRISGKLGFIAQLLAKGHAKDISSRGKGTRSTASLATISITGRARNLASAAISSKPATFPT